MFSKNSLRIHLKGVRCVCSKVSVGVFCLTRRHRFVIICATVEDVLLEH